MSGHVRVGGDHPQTLPFNADLAASGDTTVDVRGTRRRSARPSTSRSTSTTAAATPRRGRRRWAVRRRRSRARSRPTRHRPRPDRTLPLRARPAPRAPAHRGGTTGSCGCSPALAFCSRALWFVAEFRRSAPAPDRTSRVSVHHRAGGLDCRSPRARRRCSRNSSLHSPKRSAISPRAETKPEPLPTVTAVRARTGDRGHDAARCTTGRSRSRAAEVEGR